MDSLCCRNINYNGWRLFLYMVLLYGLYVPDWELQILSDGASPTMKTYSRLETQQNIERCAALVRFEQTRQFLVHRLVEHNGRDFPVMQQALEFVRANGEVANICSKASSADNETLLLQKNHTGSGVKFPKGIVSFINSSFQVMVKPLKLQKAAGVILRLGVATTGLLLALKLQRRCQTSLKVRNIMPKKNAGHQIKS